jgi:hypothetical protein
VRRGIGGSLHACFLQIVFHDVLINGTVITAVRGQDSKNSVNSIFTLVHTIVRCVLLINTCVSYMLSKITVIMVGVLFYRGYMFRRLIGLSSGYSGGLHCHYHLLTLSL